MIKDIESIQDEFFEPWMFLIHIFNLIEAYLEENSVFLGRILFGFHLDEAIVLEL